MIAQLKKELMKDPRRKLFIAERMGLTTTNAIDKWISRKEVPVKKQHLLKEVLRELSKQG